MDKGAQIIVTRNFKHRTSDNPVLVSTRWKHILECLGHCIADEMQTTVKLKGRGRGGGGGGDSRFSLAVHLTEEERKKLEM